MARAAHAEPDVAETSAPASPPPSLSLLPAPQVHAFVSQGFIKGTKNNFLVDSKRGSFEFTDVGINFTEPLTDRLRTGVQLFASQLGKAGDFTARMDWFYLDYRFADWLGLRVGRTKIPFGLYNEINDIDSARVPVLLPQSVYPILNRDILLAQTGAELYGYFELGRGGGLEYRLYGGTLFVSPPAAPAGATLADFQVPYLFGGRLMWDAPLEGLRLGGNVQALRFNTTFDIPRTGMPTLVLEEDLPFLLWLASAEYSHRDLLLAAEYGRWRADVEITGAPTYRVVNERYYAMAAYRFTRWFVPGVYYASLVTDIHKPMTIDNYRRDWAATLRFDINPNWLVKLEGHFMNGTDELDPALNGGLPPAMLAKNWLLFLAKTTAYF
ncbi:MAG TPA: hypothetical protein VHJ20_11225 [Polyangia bacterium]|nr:hypothetical protein [Polyangia bacterium]